MEKMRKENLNSKESRGQGGEGGYSIRSQSQHNAALLVIAKVQSVRARLAHHARQGGQGSEIAHSKDLATEEPVGPILAAGDALVWCTSACMPSAASTPA